MADEKMDLPEGDPKSHSRNIFTRFCGPAVWSRWSCGKGDISGFFQLFFDNVATSLTLVFLLGPFGLGLLQSEEIYSGFLPGLGISMLFGNLYYAWMACRLGAAEDRNDVTANPYGINTPGAFAYLFGVLGPVGWSLTCPEGMDPTSGECASWKSKETLAIGVSANFVQAIIAALLGLVAPWIQRVCPVASLTSALGGIGITFLGIGQVIYAYEQPLAGLVPLFLMLIIYFSGLRTGYAPEALVIAGAGTILGWADGIVTGGMVRDAATVVGWKTPQFLLVPIFQNMGKLAPYFGTIIPVAITAATNTLMCWQTATKNGDQFPLIETMVVDGVGSAIAAIFGCPFGTSVYIGHTAYKRVGAKSGYSLLNAASFIILTLFGLMGLVQAIIPIQAVAPIIVFVGLMIGADAFESVPFRHIAAVLLGFMPSIGDWAVNQCSMETADGEMCNISTAPVNAGLVAFKSGALLVAMLISGIFAHVCDRKYLQAAIWSTAAAFISLFGIIHAPAASINFDNGTPQAQWRFCVGYLMVGAICLILFLCQRFFPSLVDPTITDPKEYMSVYQLVHVANRREDGVEEAIQKTLDEGPIWQEVDSRNNSMTGPPAAAAPEIDSKEAKAALSIESTNKSNNV
eukprot:jgi/Tetstr1/434310/TSEL_023416.t1